MHPRKFRFFAFALAVSLMMPVCMLHVSAAPGVSAASAILFEPSTGKVLYEKDADKRRPMASTTKIMTALTALGVIPLDEEIAVPREAVGVEGTSTYLEEGEILTFRDLLYALLLQSANDAAVAIAIAADGSTEKFAERMNALAGSFGLTDTHFKNPHGLPDEEHYTTARELALIAAKAMENPVFRTVVSTEKYSFSSSVRRRYLTNHNKLLRIYPDAVGIKTGFTKTSGRCLVGAAEEDGLLLISVTLDAPDDWNDHMHLFRLGFSLYERRKILQAGEVEWTVPVIGGSVAEVSLRNMASFSAVMPKDAPDVTVDIVIPAYPIAPIKEGDQVGFIRILQKGREIGRLPLCASADVPLLKTKKKGIFPFFH